MVSLFSVQDPVLYIVQGSRGVEGDRPYIRYCLYMFTHIKLAVAVVARFQRRVTRARGGPGTASVLVVMVLAPPVEKQNAYTQTRTNTHRTYVSYIAVSNNRSKHFRTEGASSNNCKQ